jgi:Uma2 family endonuclease
MTTVVLGHEPVIEAWLADRRAKGLDGRDEVWEGSYHVAPHEHGRNGAVAMELVVLLREPARAAGLRAGGSFNLGEPLDFRVPDLGWHRGSPEALYFDTAALLVEVLSPGDESYRKFDFYARHRVEELWIVDPVECSVRMWVLQDGAYDERTASALLGMTVSDVVDGIDWP